MDAVAHVIGNLLLLALLRAQFRLLVGFVIEGIELCTRGELSVFVDIDAETVHRGGVLCGEGEQAAGTIHSQVPDRRNPTWASLSGEGQ